MVLSVCLLIAAAVYGLRPEGPIAAIYATTALFVLVISGFGLIVSNYSETLQQAMFVMFFFMMIFILMSGLFTPISSMPEWAQKLAYLNPLKYFIQIIRSIYLKGSTIVDISEALLSLSLFAIAINAWAVISYRKKN